MFLLRYKRLSSSYGRGLGREPRPWQCILKPRAASRRLCNAVLPFPSKWCAKRQRLATLKNILSFFARIDRADLGGREPTLRPKGCLQNSLPTGKFRKARKALQSSETLKASIFFSAGHALRTSLWFFNILYCTTCICVAEQPGVRAHLPLWGTSAQNGSTRTNL